MKRILAGAAVVFLGLSCSPKSADKPTDTGGLEERTVHLQDGRVLTCVISGVYGGDMLDCDWDHATNYDDSPAEEQPSS